MHMGAFGLLVAGWLAGQPTHEITVHVLPEQYFSLTTISRNSIFQSCWTSPSSLRVSLLPHTTTSTMQMARIRIGSARKSEMRWRNLVSDEKVARELTADQLNSDPVDTDWFGWLLINRLWSHRPCQNACRYENVVAAPGGHAASRNDMEICLASTQDQSIMRIPKDMPVNLTGNW